MRTTVYAVNVDSVWRLAASYSRQFLTSVHLATRHIALQLTSAPMQQSR
jgi:hypothetical protein